MGFITLYIVIPTLIFIFKPLRNNKILALYLLLVSVLSYDNVTDFYIYEKEFQYYLNGQTSEEFNAKGRELGWMILMKSFNFTKYGITIIHSIVLFCTVLTFIKFSQRIGIMSISVLLYFILNLTTLHDNILRQDISIIFAYFTYFEILKDEVSWTVKRYAKIIFLVIGAVLFHFSAIILVPLFFFIIWMSKIQIKLSIIFPIISALALIGYVGLVDKTFGMFFFFLGILSNDYTIYYMDLLENSEVHDGGILGFLTCIISIAPLYYFTKFNVTAYKSNKWLRLSVNLTCIIFTWKYMFSTITVLTRFADYLIWFGIWGFAYMFIDVARRKQPILIHFVMMFCVLILYTSIYRTIVKYYGDNTYLTILSDESKAMKIYDIHNTEFGKKRIR